LKKSSQTIKYNSSQNLIRPTWYKTLKEIIILEYFDFKDNPIFQIKVDTSKREDIFSLNVDENLLTHENLKEQIDLIDLRDM